jgi:hypothetical protein
VRNAARRRCSRTTGWNVDTNASWREKVKFILLKKARKIIPLKIKIIYIAWPLLLLEIHHLIQQAMALLIILSY